jgi:hypothetical protein
MQESIEDKISLLEMLREKYIIQYIGLLTSHIN